MEVNTMDKRERHVTRRSLVRRASVVAAALAMPAYIRRASAAEDTVTIMGVETAALDDWSAFERATGVTVKFQSLNSHPGLLREEIIESAAGKQVDILLLAGGIEDELGEKGLLLPIDGRDIPSWARIPDSIRNSPLAQGRAGTQYGLPVVMNADRFAYYSDELNEDEPLSYSFLFESEKTRGRVDLEDYWLTTFPMAASYVSTSGRYPVADPADMTADEAKAVADYLIERKKAGQFRSFWSSWEESVSLLTSKEVIAINCWEPAALEVQKTAGAVRYATTLEGYNKWMICAYVPTQVNNTNKYSAVARVLEGFLGGLYSADVATRSGYATVIPEAGLTFANESHLPAADVAAIEGNIKKSERNSLQGNFGKTRRRRTSKRSNLNSIGSGRLESLERPLDSAHSPAPVIP